MLDFLISPAFAQQQAQQPNAFVSLLPMVVLVILFYFLLIRPQSKRNKEHKQMLEKLSIGDEIVVSGGIAGKLTALGENFLTVEVADNTVIKVQRQSIATVLPKGTLKNL